MVLVGLASKNAILIVEFARARQEAGLKRFEAVVEASTLRLRPILMTSFAFILGVLPLVVSTGAGAEGRRLLGTAVFSGGGCEPPRPDREPERRSSTQLFRITWDTAPARSCTQER